MHSYDEERSIQTIRSFNGTITIDFIQPARWFHVMQWNFDDYLRSFCAKMNEYKWKAY